MLTKSKLLYVFIAIIFYVGVFGLFFTKTNTISSGFHFINDHEYVRMEYDLANNSFFETVKIWYKHEFENNRMRFLFYPVQITMVKIVGSSAYVHSMISFAVLISTSIFLFLFLYYRNYNFIISLSFPMLTLVGDAFAVYWKLGLQENICMHIVAITLGLKVIMTKQSVKKTYQDIAVGLLIIAVTMMKESFIVFAPFLVFICIWIEFEDANYEKPVLILKRNIYLISSVVLAVGIQLFVIVKYIGTSGANGGGRGVDDKFDILLYLKTWWLSIFTNNLSLMALVSILSLLLVLVVNKSKDKSVIWVLSFSVISYILIVGSQQFIYLKGGMSERYFLPHQMGYSLLIVTLFNYTFQNISQHLYLKYIVLSLFTFLVFSKVLNNFKTLFPQAKAFTAEGKLTKNFLSFIIGKANNNSNIVIAGDLGYYGVEYIYSITHYLSIKLKNDHIKLLQTKYNPSVPYNDFCKNQESLMIGSFPNNLITTEQLSQKGTNIQTDMIICMRNIENNFLYLNQEWFNPYTYNGFQKTNIGHYTVFTKN